MEKIKTELIINGQIHGTIHADTQVTNDDDSATGFVIKVLSKMISYLSDRQLVSFLKVFSQTGISDGHFLVGSLNNKIFFKNLCLFNCTQSETSKHRNLKRQMPMKIWICTKMWRCLTG
jgi:hypothetical protein